MPRTKKTIEKPVETPSETVDQKIDEMVADGEPISFKLKNGSTRTFSSAVHGADYKKISEEFAKTNERQIIKI